MEIRQTGKHLTRLGETPASQPSEEQLKTITKWVGIFMEHHHKEISELGMVAYIEGLRDMSPQQIERACGIVLREVDRMPTVAHIRARVYDSSISTRPDYLDENPISDEERTAALEYSEKLKETLAMMDQDKPAPSRPVFTSTASPLFQADYEAYAQWLKQEEEKDEVARKQGLTPLPRSREERLALFYNLPVQERRRLRKKAEWIRRSTNST